MSKYESERVIYLINRFEMNIFFRILQNGNLIIRRFIIIPCTF